MRMGRRMRGMGLVCLLKVGASCDTYVSLGGCLFFFLFFFGVLLVFGIGRIGKLG